MLPSLPLPLASRENSGGPLRDQPPLFLGEGGIEMQREGIGVGTYFRHEERHLLRHQV